MKRVLLCGIMVSVIGFTTMGIANAQTVFTDGVFADADWTFHLFEVGAGGTVAYHQSLSGGNPGEFRVIRNTVPANSGEARVYGFYLREEATYNPSAQGEISSITYSEDSVQIDPICSSCRQNTGPALLQVASGRGYTPRRVTF